MPFFFFRERNVRVWFCAMWTRVSWYGESEEVMRQAILYKRSERERGIEQKERGSKRNWCIEQEEKEREREREREREKRRHRSIVNPWSCKVWLSSYRVTTLTSRDIGLPFSLHTLRTSTEIGGRWFPFTLYSKCCLMSCEGDFLVPLASRRILLQTCVMSWPVPHGCIIL